MKQNHVAKINKPIIALSASFSHAVISNNWIDFIEYSNFLVDVIGKVSDRSISPNGSTILRSLFDIVNHVSVLLLEKGEYEQFSVFSEKVIKRYYGRDRKNEAGISVSYISYDLVLSRFIKTIYDETSKLAIASYHDLDQRLNQLNCMKWLHFLFTYHEDPLAFQQIVSTHFTAIIDNPTISMGEKAQILRGIVADFFRITERDLNVLLKSPFNLSIKKVLASYIYDWTSILKQFYVNNDKSMIEYVFSFISSPTLGNEFIEKNLYPCLAINLLMIAVTYSQSEGDDKGSLLSFEINGKYKTYSGIYEYITSQQHLRNYDLLRDSYLSMVRLVEVWKDRANRLTTFDYSPEIFLILVSVFMYEPCNYPEILKWTVVDRLPRCDRFNEIIDEIKKCISKYPDNESNTHIDRTFISFTAVFESTIYPLENEASRIISNLDMLKSEAFLLLRTT